MQQHGSKDLFADVEEPDLERAPRVLSQPLDGKRGDSQQAQCALHNERKVAQQIALALAFLLVVFGATLRDGRC
jgi:hypothetical protein